MRFVNLPPDAQTLLESMRAVGYSFETAVADILDNSITAEATEIDIAFSTYEEPYVSILDNGLGLDADQLRIAMRHGSRNALLKRKATDMGRFGLGLKTASLSQCRCLTVLSIKRGNISGARWDFDVIKERKDWDLLELDPADFDSIPSVEKLRAMEEGTLVVWQNLDRIFEGENQRDRALQNKIDDARSHLALVYHRFLGWDSSPELQVQINNVPVSPVDPYLRGSKGGQVLPC